MAFVEIDWRGQRVSIEYAWLNTAQNTAQNSAVSASSSDAPLMVFLHEGLGSLAMWKDFPQSLCTALGVRGLVYSRPGYGRSTPRSAGERWASDFMHRQADEVLPALLKALNVQEAPWLFGHSDGGSIALLHARQHPVAGLIVVAPHLFVEDLSIQNIRRARDAYETGDLRQRLARYHDDVDSAFWGWNRIWLNAAFRAWNITQDIRSIPCPVLAVQGVDDEYGTLAQIRGIAARLPQAQLVEIIDCKHSPHRDQPQTLTRVCQAFFRQHASVPQF